MNIDVNKCSEVKNHQSICPIITIITVSYNAENGIERTIKSVIEQECDDLEFLIIDGKSKDSTINIINKYKNKITKIISEPDKGLYDAMNKGIDYSSGKYILFLNADDMLADKFVIRDVINYIKDIDYNVDVLYGNAIYELNTKNITIKPKELHLLSREMIFSHQSVFVKRAVLQKNKFDLKYRYVADYNQLSAIYLNGFNFTYFDRNISISATGSGITYENTYKSVREHYSIDRFRKNPYSKLTMYKILILKKLVHIKSKIISSINSIIKKQI